MYFVKKKHPSKILLQSWLDDEVSTAQKNRIKEHVASCTLCQVEVQELAAVMKQMDNMEETAPKISTNTQEAIFAGAYALLDERKSRIESRRQFRESFNDIPNKIWNKIRSNIG